MKPTIEKKNEKVSIRADEGQKHVEKKLVAKGVGRLDRHPADGLPLKHDPKKGHGGKYTWEGPEKELEGELEAEPAIDERDPNFVAEEAEESELLVGEVEVAKAAAEGVARLEVDPHLKVN